MAPVVAKRCDHRYNEPLRLPRAPSLSLTGVRLVIPDRALGSPRVAFAFLVGAKGREKRPAFDRLCGDAAKRQFDMVMAWSVDRLGRSLPDLVGFLSELHALGIVGGTVRGIEP
jgi:Resolvase, N terminal domain